MRVQLDRKARARLTSLLVSGRYSSRNDVFKDAVRLVNLREAELALLDASLRYADAASEAGLGDKDEVAAAVVVGFRN